MILSNHKDVFTFKELHFFGTLWTLSDKKKITQKVQIDLMSRLLCIQEGYFQSKTLLDFYCKAKNILKNKHCNNSLDIYKLFLNTITKENKAFISCEQTKKLVLY